MIMCDSIFFFIPSLLINECNAYTCSDHWILMDIDLEHGNLTIWDSLAKPKVDYQEMIDMIQR